MNTEDRIAVVAKVLLAHDTKAEYSSTCICGDKLWCDGKGGMARHRAERIVAVLESAELGAKL